MRIWAAAVAVSMVFGSTLAHAADPPAAVPPAPSADASSASFGFVHVVMRLPEGDSWEHVKGGIFCIPNATRTWTGGAQEQRIAPYAAVLREEMKAASLKVDGDPDNVFEQSASSSDLQLAAIINDA